MFQIFRKFLTPLLIMGFLTFSVRTAQGAVTQLSTATPTPAQIATSIPLTTTPTPTQTVTSIPPTATPTPTPSYKLLLPQTVGIERGWSFTIDKIELLPNISGYTPRFDVFLLMLGNVSNRTTARDCIDGEEFILTSGERSYRNSYSESYHIFEAVHDNYDLDWVYFSLGEEERRNPKGNQKSQKEQLREWE